MKNVFPPTSPDPAVKAKNKKQIAEEMGVHPNTLRRHLKEIGLHIPRGVISPQLQQEIFHRLRWCEKV